MIQQESIIYAEPADTQLLALAVAIPLIYLLYFFVRLLQGKQGSSYAGKLGLAVSGMALVFSVVVFFKIWSVSTVIHGPNELGDWVKAGNFSIGLDILVDRVSSLMLIIINAVSLIVHVYSLKYMAGEANQQRYWTYLALFVGSMCGLVLFDNLLLLFACWELVGLCSYLLIGFWHKKPKPARASQKAFILNRIGDSALLIGILILIAEGIPTSLHHLSWGEFQGYVPDIPPDNPNVPEFSNPFNASPIAATWGCVFLFLGTLAKSAQFPLQTWLPDAMAGPTPVSALIHAATMVAAGIYLLVRISPYFDPAILEVIALTGALTAFLAALSALRQRDIKAVLAYSTISQLGYMVMGIGFGMPVVALFHLLTHAAFKAGLFLTAGNVTHALHDAAHQLKAGGQAVPDFDAQDLGNMGGLRRKLPRTFILYLFFAGSLAGLPLFSGFLSKDAILAQGLFNNSHDPSHSWVWTVCVVVGLITAGLTAFYIARHGFLIFGGKFRLAEQGPGFRGMLSRIKPAPRLMWMPLVPLALASLGILYAPGNPFHLSPGDWTLKTIRSSVPAIALEADLLIPLASVSLAILGIVFARQRMLNHSLLSPDQKGLPSRLLFHHFYLDRFYDTRIAPFFFGIAKVGDWLDRRIVDGLVNSLALTVLNREERKSSIAAFATWIDDKIIDRIVNGVANGVVAFGKRLRGLQSGQVQLYLVLTISGLLLFLLYFFYFAG